MYACDSNQVSIQLVSPTSGELTNLVIYDNLYVSIQLVSPTSGEIMTALVQETPSDRKFSFHSISFPNEWGANSSGI